MNRKTATSLVVATLFIAGITSQANTAPEAYDPVLASFDRAFNHESVPAASVTGADVQNDVLYQHINRPLQTGGEND